jgi:hypothetical protein
MVWAMAAFSFYAVAMVEEALTEDQLRAELRAAGKQALVGFALGLAVGSAG